VLKNKDKGQGSQAKDSVDRNECTQGRDGRAGGSGREDLPPSREKARVPCYAMICHVTLQEDSERRALNGT